MDANINVAESIQVRSFIKNMTDEMQKCIQNCTRCAQVCEQTIQHCLKEGGSHAEIGHIRLLQDCADICTTSARFMLRDSPRHSKTCGVCADACLSCAEACEKISDDEIMQMCAVTCRDCAETCKKMSQVH